MDIGYFVSYNLTVQSQSVQSQRLPFRRSFRLKSRCSDGCGIYGSIERTGKCGDDEDADEVLVSVGCCEKRKNFVHNACLLNYYYLCGKGDNNDDGSR